MNSNSHYLDRTSRGSLNNWDWKVVGAEELASTEWEY